MMLGYLLLQTSALVSPAASEKDAPTAAVASQPEYQVGKTTFADVTAKLGDPNSSTSMADGTRIVAYATSRTRVKGSSFVPVIGLFAGGAKSRMSVKVFTFGPDGVLKSFTATDSNANCNAGITGANCR